MSGDPLVVGVVLQERLHYLPVLQPDAGAKINVYGALQHHLHVLFGVEAGEVRLASFFIAEIGTGVSSD